MIKEIERDVSSGYLALLVLLVGFAGDIYWFAMAVQAEAVLSIVLAAIVFTVLSIAIAGLFVVNPNEARVLQLFGDYVGTARTAGLRFANPFFTKRKVSVKVRNFETGKMKVNDKNSNPVEIAAVVVWRVVDTAEALFEVDDFEEYVHVQSESAVRALATGYAYDAHEEGEVALSSHLGEIAEKLQVQIQERLDKAGVEVMEARISHLAYAPEIANAMLQRQQASAIIAARTKIVDGAVGMVDMALTKLAQDGIVELDEERKAAMVSNLLVVLCADRGTQPVVNTGSLYQ
jgi:regulator of protease activity HflC (stomatin/prohibitin superfamily)